MSMANEAALSATAASQQGVFTRAQATAAGFGAGAIERRVRRGVWARVFPRVYRHAATPPSAVLLHRAAVLWCGPDCALSHASAGAIWRMRRELPIRPELVVARARAPRRADVDVHRTGRLDEGDVAIVRGLPVTTPVRTIIDLAGVVVPEELEQILLDARSRRLVTVRAVLVRLDELGSAGRPGAALLRAVLAPIGSVRVDRSARMAG